MSRRNTQASTQAAQDSDHDDFAEEALAARRRYDALDRLEDDEPEDEPEDDAAEVEEDETEADEDEEGDEPTPQPKRQRQPAPDVETLRRQAEEYERRFKGLQPVVQRSQEENKQLRQYLQQLEQQIAYARISQLPEEQQPLAAAAFQMEQQQKLQQQLMQERETQATEAARALVITQLSQQYGIKPEKLARFNDPYAMEAYAQDLAEIRRQTQKSSRRNARRREGRDRFEGGGNVSRPAKRPETFEEARANLAKIFANR